MWRSAAEPANAGEALSPTQATILGLLLTEGPLTRPELVERSDLSSPTVIHIVAELEAAGLVDHVESRQGARGRAAQVYALGRRSGWVLGIDYGTSHVEFVAVDLAGAVLATHRVALEGDERRPPEPDEALRSELVRFRAASTRRFGALRRVGLAVPTIVPPAHRHYRATGDAPGTSAAFTEVPGIGPSFDLTALVDALGLPRDVEVGVENNINCSALAEARRPERGGVDLLYLHLGQGGVGIGIVSGGRLLRGTTGSAGEMRWFPFPFGPDAGRPTFSLEEYFGARGFLGRVRAHYEQAGEPAPATVPEVFARAARGDAVAAETVDDYAAKVALALAAFISVIDPAVGVLGGGLGNNALLLERVEAHLAALGRPLPLGGDLGETSSARGAALLALDGLHRALGVDE
jgi:predicted NBD/HSP70 family sugar kinase